MSFRDVVEQARAGLQQDPSAAQATFAAESHQTGGLQSIAKARQFELTVDEPESLGGGDTGPNPVELVLAALGTCQEITYRLYADALGIPLSGISVKLEGDLDLRGFFGVDDSKRPGYERVRATVTLDSPASAEEIATLKAEVDRHCPVLDIIGNATPVSIDVEHRAASVAAE
jgi:uncharacterized OsmC-like protein